jgi:uncharacterized protein YjbI with pentapeptide repeats
MPTLLISKVFPESANTYLSVDSREQSACAAAIPLLLAALRGRKDMADQRLLEILKRGSGAWNEWAKKNQRRHADEGLVGWGVDLNGADLRHLDLMDANLKGADLRNAELSGACLLRADLREVDLRDSNLNSANLNSAKLMSGDLDGAKLCGATMNGAELRYAKLRGANLSGANLSGAELTYASLEGANLREADLRNANLEHAALSFADLFGAALESANLRGGRVTQTSFAAAHFSFVLLADIDLSEAKGLDTVKHDGPSTIGIDTIYRSGGNIPEVFLRGCGVPDDFITYAKSLVGKPIEFYSCFISYSALDQAFAERLYADLQAKGLRCWYFPESAKWGEPVWGEIDRGIKIYDKLIVLCSQRSLVSGPVLREIERALQREDRESRNVLFPLRIDDYLFEQWEHPRKADVLAKVVGDFRGWDRGVKKYRLSFEKLLAALRAENAPSIQTP